jgi:hypothetical protein
MRVMHARRLGRGPSARPKHTLGAVSGAAHRLVRSTRLGAVSGGHIAVFHGPYLAHHVHRRVSFERQPLAQITPPELDQSELRGSSELAQLSCELRGSSD